MSDETKSNLPVVTEESSDTMLEAASDLLLDQTIPAPLRRGIVHALNRLGGGLIDIPAGFLERRNTEKQVESEERIKFMRAVNAELIEQIKTDPEFTQRASNTYAMRILREQSNLEKVFQSAMDFLKKKRYDNSENQQADTEVGQTISEDWFNIFEKEASQKSTEDIQHRFAKVLAGEIEKPSSHSIKAIKALGDMDQATAELFQRLCSVCVILKHPEENYVDIRVPSLGGDPGENELEKYGLSYIELVTLSEYGLIVSDYYAWRGDYLVAVMDKNNKLFTPFRHQGRYWGLQPYPGRPAINNKFELPGIKLSNVGTELFRIVEQTTSLEYTQELKEYFGSIGIHMIEVIKQNGNARWSVIQR